MAVIKGNEIIVSAGGGSGASSNGNIYIAYPRVSDWVLDESTNMYTYTVSYTQYLYALGDSIIYQISVSDGQGGFNTFYNLPGNGYIVSYDGKISDFVISTDKQESCFDGMIVFIGAKNLTNLSEYLEYRSVYIKDFSTADWIAGTDDPNSSGLYVYHEEYGPVIGTCTLAIVYEKTADGYSEISGTDELNYELTISSMGSVYITVATSDIFEGRIILIGMVSLASDGVTIATRDKAGIIKVGTTMTIDEDGTLNVASYPKEVEFDISLPASGWRTSVNGGYYQDISTTDNYAGLHMSFSAQLPDEDIAQAREIQKNYAKIGNTICMTDKIRFICLYDKPDIDIMITAYCVKYIRE